MHRIKLPGKEKTKKLILIILIIVAILVLIHEGNLNIQHKKFESNNENIQEQEESINSIDVQEKVTTKESNEEVTSTEEKQLYNEVYNLFFSKKYKESIDKADELLNKFPNSFMGYNIRGIAKAYNGDYNGGISDIDKSLELNESYGYAKFNKALTYELYGNMDNALEWYNKALEDEEYVWSYYGIASIYGRRGDVSNTVKYLSKAINMDGAVKNIARTEHDFDPIRNSAEFQKIVNS